MSKHTPGRWYWDFDRDGNWSLRSDSADAGIMDQRNCPLIEDRILIESAPDLLEALDRLTKWAEVMAEAQTCEHTGDHPIALARAALIKAITGESQ